MLSACEMPVTVEIHAPAISNKNNFISRRAYLFSSNQGSLTVEASLALPFYLMFMVALMYIINIIGLQTRLYNAMEEAERAVNDNAYVIASKSGTGSSLLVSSLVLLRTSFFSDETKELISDSYIKDGTGGVNLVLTSYSSEDNMASFYISYKLTIPFMPESFSVKVIQCRYFTFFVGKDITDVTASSSETVYVTASGSVYHTTPFCSYILAGYTVYPNLQSLTGKVSPCSGCASGITSDYGGSVLYCENSRVYHVRTDCSHLDHPIYSVTLASVKAGMSECSRCKKGASA